MSPNTILTIKTQKVGEQYIMAAIISGSRPDVAWEKALRQRKKVTSAVRRRNVNVIGVISDKNPTFQPFFDKNVHASREFLKSPFYKQRVIEKSYLL